MAATQHEPVHIRMHRARYAAKLVGALATYGRANRLWWLLLLIPIAIIGSLLIGGAQTIVPYTVYTLV